MPKGKTTTKTETVKVKKAPKTLKSRLEELEESSEEKDIDVKIETRKLIKRGREQGFIAQEEVLAIFPKPEEHIEEVDDLYNKFLDEGIDVFDTTEFDVDESRSATELEKELESLATMEDGYLSDPVRMYLRAIADQARTIRIPVHMVETINKFNRLSRKLMQELGREPTPEEVAMEMEVPVEKVREIVKVSQEPASLEAPVGEEEDSRLGDFIQDASASPTDQATHALLKDHISEMLDTLSPREAKVLEYRFGLEDGKQRTLEEVGKEFGVTRERIRQIEAKAIRKLRHPTRAKKLRDYL